MVDDTAQAHRQADGILAESENACRRGRGRQGLEGDDRLAGGGDGTSRQIETMGPSFLVRDRLSLRTKIESHDLPVVSSGVAK